MREDRKRSIWDGIFRDVDMEKYYASEMNPDLKSFLHLLPEGGRVLDMGCGMGKTSVQLAGMGFSVTAVDFSDKAVESVCREAEVRGLKMDVRHQDVREFEFEGEYDLIISYGLLQFLCRDVWEDLIGRMKKHTVKGGVNFVLVFSDKIPVPEDMKEMAGDMFGEGELFEMYLDWEVLLQESYVKEDEHPGGIIHRHPMNKLVAVKR